MKVNSYEPGFGSMAPRISECGILSIGEAAGVYKSLSGTEIIKPYIDPQPKFQSDTWVQLLELPSTFSHDEALLLCQISEDEWAAWIPDHGEAVLHVAEFCALS